MNLYWSFYQLPHLFISGLINSFIYSYIIWYNISHKSGLIRYIWLLSRKEWLSVLLSTKVFYMLLLCVTCFFFFFFFFFTQWWSLRKTNHFFNSWLNLSPRWSWKTLQIQAKHWYATTPIINLKCPFSTLRNVGGKSQWYYKIDKVTFKKKKKKKQEEM